MKERTRKIFIMIVMAALIVSLMAASFAALTYGRYSGGRFDENSPYEDYIDFVGATAFTVKTPEELTNAIENGYSYIEIDDNAEKPFVVNDDIANVKTNLVLDVNGTTVIRNSRNPLLDVKRSVSVVLVYDSSEQAKGGFYNPVGSALQTSGGTLTVGAGVYESGPNEKYQTKNYSTGQQVTLFDREARTGSYLETGTSATDLPILTDRNAGTQEDPVFVYDYYFESDPEGNVNSLIEADTYLIYTKESNCYVDENGKLFVNCTKTGTEISGTSFRVESNVASCDFYYYYPVGTANEDGFYTYAVVYGYHDVKQLAGEEDESLTSQREEGEINLVWPYAAIRSEAGNTHARGGEFKTHFGKENTYSIYSAGGTMTVGGTAEPTFSAVQSGVCIKMVGQETEEQRSSLTISSGSFSSEIGNTIQMEGGAMTVTRGSFTKSDARSDGNDQIANQTAIIDIKEGTLTINGAAADSVKLTAGSADTDNGGTLENVFGILARGGEVSVGGCTLNIYGDYSAGVLSYDGTINLNDKTSITVTQSDTNKDNDNNTLLTSSAVSSEAVSSEASGEEHPINMSGNVTIESNGLGITARGTVNVTEGATTTVKASRGTGIYVNNGTFTVESDAKISVESTVLADYAWGLPPEGQGTSPNIYNGVYVQGGSLISNGTLNVTFKGVENDAQAVTGLEDLLASYNIDELGDGRYAIELGFDDEAKKKYEEFNVNEIKDSNKALYQEFQVKSYAVRVEAAVTGRETDVSIAGGKISNSVGGGVYVGGGTVTLGNKNSGPTVRATGSALFDDYYVTGKETYTSGWWPWNQTTNYRIIVSQYISFQDANDNWSYRLSREGGDAVKVVDGKLTVNDGSYFSQQGNGILISGAVADDGDYAVNIKNGSFIGNDTYGNNENGEGMPGAAASYGLKVYGGSVKIEGGTFGTREGQYNKGSGALVMGSAAGGRANFSIQGGKFEVEGTSGLAVYYGADVYIGGTENGAVGEKVSLYGASYGITVEVYGDSYPNSTITIYNQNTTIGGRQGEIWHGESKTTVTRK